MTIVAIGVSIRECGMSHIFTCNLLYYKNITKNTGLPERGGAAVGGQCKGQEAIGMGTPLWRT